jgi:ABC-type transport system involved in multi-copper enzyme maturation permease subunit
MVWGFAAVLVALAAVNAAVVVFGTDMDGSKAFIATAGDQRSLVAFAANALLGASLFGAVAVAREYAHGTVIPTFLSAPRRHRAVLAQLIAVLVFGALLGFVGAGLTVIAVALALPTTQYGFLMSAGAVAQVLAASAFAAAVGAVLGAGIGAVVRNTGGAVAGVVLALMIAPPLIVQLAHGSGSWMPAALANVLSGVTDDVAVPAAVLAMLAWAVIPAAIGLLSVQRRDVV